MKKLLLVSLIALAPLGALAETYTFLNKVLDSGTSTNPVDVMDGLSHGQAATWGLSNADGVSTSGVYGSGSRYTALLSELNGSGKAVTGATLTLKGARDWTAERYDVLYVDILKNLTAGTDEKTYNSNPSQNDNTAYGTNAFTDPAKKTILRNSSGGGALAFDDPDATYSLLRAPDSSMPVPGDSGFTSTDRTNMPGTWTDTNTSSASDVVITFSANNYALLEQYLRWDIATAGTATVGLGFAAECHYYFTEVKLSIDVGTKTVPDAGSTIALLGVALLSVAALRRRLA